MIPDIRSEDWSTIFHFSGSVFCFLGATLLIPVVIALFAAEWHSAVNFFFTTSLLLSLGCFFYVRFQPKRDANWLHGMCISAFSWIISMFILALPYYLSHHFLSYTDACFDVMSGMTTTGLIMIQDIDHLPISLNIWRHILTFIGGQGIIIIAVAFIPSVGLNYKAMVGEGKEERLLPNVKQTGRFIWIISLLYLAVGTLILFIIGLTIGFTPGWSLFHAVSMFMSTWSTGGFAPQSLNAIYYHNLLYEIAMTVFSIVGSMNFGLHYYVWFKKRRALLDDIETKSLLVSVTVLFLVMATFLMRQGIYPNLIAIFRKIVFNLISGHTTTGTQTIYSVQFINLWSPMVLSGVIVAMAIGGSSASTAGGFKGIRMGILFHSIVQDIKQYFMPSSSVNVSFFQHLGKQILTDKVIKSTMTVILFYLFFYITGAIMGVAYGYPVSQAVFDSVSAGSNTGLSAGLVSVSMPYPMKVFYILSMFLGRVEFFSGLVFITFLIRYVLQLAKR
jgi:trk system potassium uptake protein TrkH